MRLKKGRERGWRGIKYSHKQKQTKMTKIKIKETGKTVLIDLTDQAINPWHFIKDPAVLDLQWLQSLLSPSFQTTGAKWCSRDSELHSLGENQANKAQWQFNVVSQVAGGEIGLANEPSQSTVSEVSGWNKTTLALYSVLYARNIQVWHNCKLQVR